jgi:uncharacterized protein (DUF983 family)
MYPVLCPRCGIGVSYFRRDHVGPYCGECGWNLDLVSEYSRKQDWSFIKMSLAWVLLIAISALLYAISWRWPSFLCGALCVLTPLIFFAATKERSRAENLVNTVARKPGADLFSNAPDAPPGKVLACEVSLRAGPRYVRFKSSNRVVMWIASILPLTVFYASARPLFITEYRLDRFPGPWLYLFETLPGVRLWLLIFKTFRQVHPVELVNNGDISTARVIPVPDRTEAIFEFLDIRALRFGRSVPARRGISTLAPTFQSFTTGRIRKNASRPVTSIVSSPCLAAVPRFSPKCACSA